MSKLRNEDVAAAFAAQNTNEAQIKSGDGLINEPIALCENDAPQPDLALPKPIVWNFQDDFKVYMILGAVCLVLFILCTFCDAVLWNVFGVETTAIGVDSSFSTRELGGRQLTKRWSITHVSTRIYQDVRGTIHNLRQESSYTNERFLTWSDAVDASIRKEEDNWNPRGWYAFDAVANDPQKQEANTIERRSKIAAQFRRELPGEVPVLYISWYPSWARVLPYPATASARISASAALVEKQQQAVEARILSLQNAYAPLPPKAPVSFQAQPRSGNLANPMSSSLRGAPVDRKEGLPANKFHADPLASVFGIIKIDGKPANGGKIRFIPKAGFGSLSETSVNVSSDGVFNFDRALAGENRIDLSFLENNTQKFSVKVNHKAIRAGESVIVTVMPGVNTLLIELSSD